MSNANEAAQKQARELADQNKKLGTVSSNYQAQQAAETAYKQRMAELAAKKK